MQWMFQTYSSFIKLFQKQNDDNQSIDNYTTSIHTIQNYIGLEENIKK